MKDISRLIKFIISGTIYILGALFVAYTMISFLYYYFHLHQDPMGFFKWWWYGHVRSFSFMQYIFYFIAFEVILLIAGIIYVRKKEKEEKEEKEHAERYKE